MKSKVVLSLLAVAIFAAFFSISWLTLRLLAEDFRFLAPWTGVLAAILGFGLLGYVFSGKRTQSEKIPEPARGLKPAEIG